MTKPEAEALKTYIDFLAAQTEDAELGRQRKAHEEAEAAKKAEQEKAAHTIVNHQAPNVSLITYYDPVKNCIQVDVKAWQALSDEEKAYIEKFLRSREDLKPYPLGGYVEETGEIKPEDFDKLERHNGHFMDPQTYAGFIWPYANLKKPLKEIKPLSEEGARLWREAAEKNFNREPVLSETSNDGVNWTIAKGTKRGVKAKTLVPDGYVSLNSLAAEFLKDNGTGMAIDLLTEFARKIRALTITEVKSKTSAHLKIVDEGDGKEARAVIEIKPINTNYIPKELWKQEN